MAIGDSPNIVQRLVSLVPRGWFTSPASVRDAVFGGLGDGLAWIYGFVGTARLQTRLATAQGYFLDLFAFDYFSSAFLRRKPGQLDAPFAARIKKEIFRERVTRNGMIGALTDLTGYAPTIVEPWSTQDCAAIGYTFAAGVGFPVGSLQYPNQVFLTVRRPGAGIPNIAGIGTGGGGIGVGALTPINLNQEVGVTDPDVYSMIAVTKPTGNIAWAKLQ